MRNLKELRGDDKPVRAFISYSHKDDRFRVELETHLKLLQRERLLDVWTDRRIPPGSEWNGQIDNNLRDSDLILLLVSPDFVASDYCYDREMSAALERHEVGLARVIPIIVRDVDWHSAPFGKLQALPSDGKVIGRGNKSARDRMWRQVAEEIRRLLTSERPPRPKPPEPAPLAYRILPPRADTERWKSEILWVDSRHQDRMFERQDFAKLGVTFALAQFTKEALDFLASDRFSAIISNVNRPDEPRAGYALLNTLRNRGDHTPFFFYAVGGDRPEYRQEALDNHAQGSTGDRRTLLQMVMPVLSAIR
jgi:hypothetical protein